MMLPVTCRLCLPQQPVWLFASSSGALGLNHLLVSVQLKAHSISFHSNKLAASLISVLHKHVASFRLFDG